ncbi:MAG TPA: NlpC/P60 family protein [Chitinophagaceae bacterium]
MKTKVIFFAILLACVTVKAQKSANILKSVNNKQLLALNFINNVSFTPEVNTVPLLNTSSPLNIFDIKPLTEIVAEPSVENIIEKLPVTQFKYAMMMDVEVETLTNSLDLYNFIDNWYGTHYRMGGTTKKGIDCSAFSGTLLSTIYSFNIPRTASEQYKICEHLNKEDLLPGDLVFFNTRGRGVSHVGVYLANNHFVHSSSSDGVKISSLDEDYYSRKFIGGGRVNQ